MKKGKIGSALAAFESNIAKNIEHGAEGGKSFLTGIASTTTPTATRPIFTTTTVPSLSFPNENDTLQRQRGSTHRSRKQSSTETVHASTEVLTARCVLVEQCIAKSSKKATAPFQLPNSTSSQQTISILKKSTRKVGSASKQSATVPVVMSPKKTTTCSSVKRTTGSSNTNKSKRGIPLPTTSNHSDAHTASTMGNSSFESQSPVQLSKAISIPTEAIAKPLKARSRSRQHDASTEAMAHVASPIRRRSSIGRTAAVVTTPSTDTSTHSCRKSVDGSNGGSLDTRKAKKQNTAAVVNTLPVSSTRSETTVLSPGVSIISLSSPRQRGKRSSPAPPPMKLSLHIDSTGNRSSAPIATAHLTGKSICSDPVVTSSFRGLRVVEPHLSFSSLPLRPKNPTFVEALNLQTEGSDQQHTQTERTSDQKQSLLYKHHAVKTAGPSKMPKPIADALSVDDGDDTSLMFPMAYVISSPNKTTAASSRKALPCIPQSPASTCSSEASFTNCSQVETGSQNVIITTPQQPTTRFTQSAGNSYRDCSERSLRSDELPATRIDFPRSPMPTKALMRAIQNHVNDDRSDCKDEDVASINEGESSDTFHDSSSINLMTKLSRVQETKSASFHGSSDDMSLCTLDINRQPKYIQKTTSRYHEDSISSNASSSLFSSFASFLDTDVVKPKYTRQVFGILRHPPIVRNIMHRVAFADQQPGGGRRMNNLIDRSSKRDAQPMQPRRPRQSTIDQLRQATSSPTLAAVPVGIIKSLAATKIQSSARQWIQWRKTRVTLLKRKLIRIEASRKDDIVRICAQKWRAMETMQFDIHEETKRFESQIALSEKLMDHLKRDSTLVKGQNKQMQECSQIIKRNNVALETSMQQSNDNFFTMNIAIKLLREKSDTLLDESKRYASHVDKIQAKLQEASRQVETEVQAKRASEQNIKRMLSLIKLRSRDKNLLNHISNMLRASYDQDDRLAFAGNGSFLLHETESAEEPAAFDLSLKGHDNDDMSVFSDITDIYCPSTTYKPAFDVSTDFSVISEGQETSGTGDSSIHLHDYDDDDDISDNSDASSLESGTSFVSSYSPNVEVICVEPSTPRKDSFADYTPLRAPCTPGDVSAPRRHLSNEQSVR